MVVVAQVCACYIWLVDFQVAITAVTLTVQQHTPILRSTVELYVMHFVKMMCAFVFYALFIRDGPPFLRRSIRNIILFVCLCVCMCLYVASWKCVYTEQCNRFKALTQL